MPTLKADKWWAVVNLPREVVDGKVKRRQVWGSQGWDSKKDAEAEEIRLRYQLQRPVHRTDLTSVGQLVDEWLGVAESRVAPRTYEGYQYLAGLVKAALGHLRLEQFSERHVQELYKRWSAKPVGRADKAHARAAVTVQNLHRVVKMVCRYGVKTGRLQSDPTAMARVPGGRAQEVRVLDDAEVKLLLPALDGWLRLPVLLALYTGLRLGEVCALTWEDVDMERKQLTVRHSIQKDNVVKAPKSGKARVVPFDGTCVQLLRSLPKHEGRLVPENPGSVSHAFHRLVKAVLPRRTPRFHDLRHTHASWLLREGVPLVDVSQRLGHGSIAITAQVYAHHIPGRGHQTAAVFEAAMARALA